MVPREWDEARGQAVRYASEAWALGSNATQEQPVTKSERASSKLVDSRAPASLIPRGWNPMPMWMMTTMTLMTWLFDEKG